MLFVVEYKSEAMFLYWEAHCFLAGHFPRLSMFVNCNHELILFRSRPDEEVGRAA